MFGFLNRFMILAVLCGLFQQSAGAADVLSIDNIAANAGDSDVFCFIRATHDSGIEGFAVGIQYNPIHLNLSEVDFQDTAVSGLLSGAEPDFAGISIDSVTGVLLAGVIFSYGDLSTPPATLPASPDDQNALMRLNFSVSSISLPATIPIQFVNGLGDPPIDSVLSSGGFSIIPTLVDGSLTINNLHRFYFGSIAATPGSLVTATLRYDH